MAQAPLSATTASSSWWDFVPGSSYLWPKPVPLTDFAVSLCNGVSSFRSRMATFKQADQKLSVSQINTSYAFKSFVGDLKATYKFSNLDAHPTENLSLSMAAAKGVRYTEIDEKAYMNLLDYSRRFNQVHKDASIQIKNAEGVTDFSKVDIVFKSSVALSDDMVTLENTLVDFRKSAETANSVIQAILKGKEPPKIPEEVGEFVLVPNIQGSLQKREGGSKNAELQNQASASSPPPIGLTAEILNSKRSFFEWETANMPLSKFTQHYTFKMAETRVVTAAYNSKEAGIYKVSTPLTLKTPARVVQSYIKGYQQYANTTKVCENGKVVISNLNLETRMILLSARIQPAITTNEANLNKALNNFYWTAQNIRVTPRVAG